MKIGIDESVDVEFDPWALEKAGKHIEEIKSMYRDRSTNELETGRFDSVMRGMFALLLFGQIEKTKPGTIQKLMQDSELLAKAMTKPEPTE